MRFEPRLADGRPSELAYSYFCQGEHRLFTHDAACAECGTSDRHDLRRGRHLLMVSSPNFGDDRALLCAARYVIYREFISLSILTGVL